QLRQPAPRPDTDPRPLPGPAGRRRRGAGRAGPEPRGPAAAGPGGGPATRRVSGRLPPACGARPVLPRDCRRPADHGGDGTMARDQGPPEADGEPGPADGQRASMSASRRWLVGRAPHCDLILNHPTISSYHCSLTETPAGFLLEDLRSAGGTYVNGQRVDARI